MSPMELNYNNKNKNLGLRDAGLRRDNPAAR